LTLIADVGWKIWAAVPVWVQLDVPDNKKRYWGFKLRKCYMKKFLSVCYIVFVIAVNAHALNNDFKRGYPLWMLIFCVVAVIPGLISMFLLTFEFEPKRKWFWKIVPFVLVVYFATGWYFDFIYRRPEVTNQIIIGGTLLGTLLLYPLLYSSFKFGFGDRE
jgi:uncharacterized membrane protein